MVVQKFGGTSVADPDAIGRLDADRARRACPRRPRPGRRRVGDERRHGCAAGDCRRRRVWTSGRGAGTAWRSSASDIWRQRSALTSADESRLARRAHQTSFDQLVAVVRALGVLREVSPRTLDVVAAMGELLSSRIVAAALAARRRAGGVGGRAPRHRHQRRPHPGDAADARDQRRAPRVGPPGARRRTRAGARRLRRRHGERAHDDARARRVGLLGRARGRRASAPSEIQIWTDVDGMLTADPARHRARRAWCRCSRLPKRPSWRTSAPRCCIPSTILPGGRARHPRADSELAQAGGDGHPHHRRPVRPTARRSPRSPRSATSR